MLSAEPAPTLASRQTLEVRNLSVAFRSFELHGVSFDLRPGQITVLLGHNGAGKTTTMRLITGLIRKRGGTVRIGGISHEQEKEFRRRVTLVPDDGNYYAAMTIGDLIEFVAGFYPDWNWEACETLLRSFRLDRSKRTGELSKGMRAKTGLVLAFSHDPDAVLMDEPTSGLDPRSRAELIDVVRTAAREHGRSILFSTHNLLEAEELADRLIILDQGRVLADEPLAEARAAAGETSWSLERYYLRLVQ